ncbi:MAG: DUF4440 domain-containing protein [Bacteroidetes bacterium]|nr:hypothetical protein AWN76_016445 [Rhodothermaceae bacterium RA]RMH64084.1 MAG: DUF4440 domain-containing protein [Bacteroidota bacterium]
MHASCPLLFLWLPAALLAGCADPGRGPAPDPEARAAIEAVLNAQVAAWNAGDLRGFMDGYARTDSLRFASGGAVRQGWQTALDAYERTYPDRAAMGTLAFHDLDVRLLSPRWALVFGRWHLQRAPEQGDAGGLFTLLFERRPEGWRIVHDHTSSAPS